MIRKPICKVTHFLILEGRCPWCECVLGQIEGRLLPSEPLWNLQALESALEDANEEVRLGAVSNIWRATGLDVETKLELLAKALQDSSARVRELGESALGDMGLRACADDAKRLDALLPAPGLELATRIMLLGYYCRVCEGSSNGRRIRRNHVLWLIEHAPRSTTAGTPLADFTPGDDDVGYLKCRALWLNQIQTYPDDPVVFGNAGRFFILHDFILAEQLLQRARSLEPRNPEWPKLISLVYSFQTGREPANGNTVRAFRELEAAEDIKRGTPWHADLSGQIHQRGDDVVMTLLDRINSLSALARTACQAGKFVEAAAYASELLDFAGSEHLPECFRNEGTAVHAGNIVLGRCALREGNIDKACEHLLAAGRSAVSPHLGSFGPNMMLAKELLEQGEVEVVIGYFQLCKGFWVFGEHQLNEWIDIVREGGVPDFGPNISY